MWANFFRLPHAIGVHVERRTLEDQNLEGRNAWMDSGMLCMEKRKCLEESEKLSCEE